MDEMVETSKSRAMTGRARDLRAMAANMLEPLAIAYRRRAAELELAAAILGGARTATVLGGSRLATVLGGSRTATVLGGSRLAAIRV